jgi:MFS transporter, ACS family, glucarate transporter
MASSPLPAVQRPTRVRYWVVVFAVTLAIITYIDRVCLSFAAPFVREDLGLSKVQMGYAFTAFGVAYAAFEIPGGLLGDWLGPRKVLMRIVCWWSSFTVLTGSIFNFPSIMITQFCFGAGEAGCFPNLTKAFTSWLPQQERVRAQGIMWLSARWGGAFTPLLVRAVLGFTTWRWAFRMFGCLGAIWAICFYRWYRDNPLDNARMNQAERDLVASAARNAGSHHKVPLQLFLQSRQVWLLCLQYFCLSYGWYFYITWLPTYLREGRHLELGSSALLSVLPLFLGGLGSFSAGLIAAPLTRWTRDVAKTRRVMAYAGFTGASGLLIVSTLLHDPLAAMLAMGMASFSNDLVMPGAWGAAMDVGGKYAGTLSGSMNMLGNVGGALSPLAIGYILSWTHNNWDMAFYVSAAIYFMGVFCWMFLDPVTPLENSEA